MPQAPLSETEVFGVIRDHLVDIVGEIEPDSVRLDSSMKQLGASSLDIVDVVSCTTRELKLRVPRAELASIDEIRPLVELLTRLAQDPSNFSADAD